MASTPKYKLVRSESGDEDFQALLGEELEYDDGFSADGKVDDGLWSVAGTAAEKASKYGLPAMVRGNPLGCGCSIAHLHAIGKVVNGQVEVDYMCDSGWHNFMVFNVQQRKKPKERQVLIDKFGNLTADKGFKATDLEEF